MKLIGQARGIDGRRHKRRILRLGEGIDRMSANLRGGVFQRSAAERQQERKRADEVRLGSSQVNRIRIGCSPLGRL
jgi:hypothetical protein